MLVAIIRLEFWDTRSALAGTSAEVPKLPGSAILRGWQVDSRAYAEGYGPGRILFDNRPQLHRNPPYRRFVLPHWVPLAGACAVVLWSLCTSLRYRRLRLAGRCSRCGYDQRGLSPARPCPECGVVPAPGQRRSAAMLSSLRRGAVSTGLLLILLGGASWIALSGLRPPANADSVAAFQIGPDRCGLAWLPERLWYPVSKESSAAATFAESELPSEAESLGWMREDRDRSWAIELRLWWVVIFGCIVASVGWAVRTTVGASEQS